MEQLEKIISIIKRVGEATIDPNLVITGDTDIVADLQFDSIDMVLIVGEIEEAFGISIENDMIQEIRTVNDLNEKVRQLSA
ncbi:MAG: acyl carrier protein [Ruminococcus sp.]|nr:phosphopantetheine-binding protein [Ruminococcus sp.]CDE33412.1 acyl carrier protein 1 [Ruminococcus sp. CAG:403]